MGLPTEMDCSTKVDQVEKQVGRIGFLVFLQTLLGLKDQRVYGVDGRIVGSAPQRLSVRVQQVFNAFQKRIHTVVSGGNRTVGLGNVAVLFVRIAVCVWVCV